MAGVVLLYVLQPWEWESTRRKNQTGIKRGAASLSQIFSTDSYMLAKIDR